MFLWDGFVRSATTAGGTVARILAADIGGTNSRFGFFESGPGAALTLRHTIWLHTKQAGSFGDLLVMLRDAHFPVAAREVDIAVVAVAGPVLEGRRSAPPFIDWEIDFTRAEAEFGFRRHLLINDFVAQAFATISPAAASARPILAGRPLVGAARAVIGAGTGLGQAALLPDGRGGHLAVPSEGGHAEFPFVGEDEAALGEFLRRDLGVPAVTSTMVVSGAGVANVHRYLTGSPATPEEATAGLVEGSQALAWGARFYGRACKLYALHAAAFGGLFVAGGIAARTPGLLAHAEFEREFRTSQDMADRLREIPVWLVSDQESGLWGAALLGAQTLAGVVA